jgi:hypothetical protein
MYSLNNDFLGYHPSKHNVNFSGSDTEELYQQNLKTQPNDWYYRTNQISYVRNSNGHRCKDIEDIDLDNYILFTGCSHTEGIGLKLEDTYPYLMSKKLNIDYYNLAIGGSGIDTLSYNLMTWFSTVKKKPKFVVLQWTYHNRFVANTIIDKNTDNYELYGSWSTNNDVQNMLVSGDLCGYFEVKRDMMRILLKNVIDCPIIEVAYPNARFNPNIHGLPVAMYNKDYDARDYIHAGVDANIRYSEFILTKLKDK